MANEARDSGWICCEWLWVLYQCRFQIKAFSDGLTLWVLDAGGWEEVLLSGVRLGAIHTFTKLCKLQRPLLALEALPPLPTIPQV